MKHEIGVITALNRYPVKSMAGEALETAELGWQGIRGDRRLAFRKVGDTSGFPWLTASKLPELLLFHPLRKTENISPAPAMMNLPTHIRTPDGYELEPYSDALREDVSRRCKIDVELTHLKHGIFDESPISLISTATMNAITMNAIGSALDARRFRPNIVIETTSNRPFAEDEYVGKSLVFGEEENSAGLHVALLDERCMMVNLDPDTAESNPAMMKTVVKLNNNNAGVYCTITRTGTLTLGQKVFVLAS
jgi:hypothetical protein